MSWFQLDASTLASRAHSAGDDATIPTLGASIRRGLVGFTLVSVAGFVPWAVFGEWLTGRWGEGGMVGVCAVVFLLLSGLLLHRLILGPDSLVPFCKLFSLAFAAYAAAWVGGWMGLGGHLGSVLGLLAGAALMGWMLTRAFEAQGVVWKVIAVLFVLNALGYFAGGLVEGAATELGGFGLPKGAQTTVGKLLWGACYGLGFGAGLGWAFHLCQGDAREMLRAQSARAAGEGK